jgi:hypothetical protein
LLGNWRIKAYVTLYVVLRVRPTFITEVLETPFKTTNCTNRRHKRLHTAMPSDSWTYTHISWRRTFAIIRTTGTSQRWNLYSYTFHFADLDTCTKINLKTPN